MNFYREEYRQLLKVVAHTPNVKTLDDWEHLLGEAGIPTGRFALEGRNREVIAGKILEYLDDNQNDALYRRFITVIIDYYSADETDTPPLVFLTSILNRPTAIGRADPWLPAIRDARFIEEALSMGNAPSHFTSILAKAERSVSTVALIQNQHRGTVGTGTLLTSRFLLTCRHVLPTTLDAANASFIFNFEYTIDDMTKTTTTYKHQRDTIFHVSNQPHLDYALVEIDAPVMAGFAGAQTPIAAICDREPIQGEPIYMVHHMHGKEKRIGFSRIADYRSPLLGYLIDTMPGSSGGAIFNAQSQLLGLHEGSAEERPNGKQFLLTQNQGLAIQAILADLPTELYSQIIAHK